MLLSYIHTQIYTYILTFILDSFYVITFNEQMRLSCFFRNASTQTGLYPQPLHLQAFVTIV